MAHSLAGNVLNFGYVFAPMSDADSFAAGKKALTGADVRLGRAD
jgi:hypothetical protein